MKLTIREIDALEDLRVLSVARAQGMYGIETAKKYSMSLQERSQVAVTAGCLDDAIWYAQRDCDFLSRFFGVKHTYARMSVMCLQLLVQHKETMGEEAAFEFQIAA